MLKPDKHVTISRDRRSHARAALVERKRESIPYRLAGVFDPA